MTIDEATEISSRGYNNTLNNSQRVLADAYIQIVLENEHEMTEDHKRVLDELFEQILNHI